MKTDRKGKIDVISSIWIKCVVGILFVLVVILFTIFYFYKR